MHLGEGVWLLIDSCIDPNTKEVASIAYLESIGVRADCVKAVVASHWHDDHVRGISKMAAKYPEAEFFHSAVFTDREASAFLAAHNGHSSAGLARGAKELFSVIEQRGCGLSSTARLNRFADNIEQSAGIGYGIVSIASGIQPICSAYGAISSGYR